VTDETPPADDTRHPGEKRPAETQEERAMRTIRAISAGGDLAAETLQLSNEFTDRQVERMKRVLRRRRN
jgi:hypothetical protein